MLFLESKLEYTFSVFDKLNSTFTIWHYKFSIYYKSVIICPIAIAYSMGQIIKSVCVCVCLSVCEHSHGRIS